MNNTATKTRICHIDNNFFYLTQAQAKRFSVDGKLPRAGYQKRADMAKLSDVELVYQRHGQVLPCAKQITPGDDGWIQQTPLSYWDGKPVNGGQVWSIRIHTR